MGSYSRYDFAEDGQRIFKDNAMNRFDARVHGNWITLDHIRTEKQRLRIESMRSNPSDEFLAMREAAIASAKKTIQEKMDVPVDLDDERMYQLSVSFGWEPDVETLEGVCWTIRYTAVSFDHDSYWVSSSYDGTVTWCDVQRGLDVDDPSFASLEPYDLLLRFEKKHMPFKGWEPETWVSFSMYLRKLAEVSEQKELFLEPEFDALLRQEYGLPDEKTISREEAFSRAIAYMRGSGYGIEGKPSEISAVYLLGEEVPVWKVRLLHIGRRGRGMADLCYEMDAYTGGIRHIQDMTLIPLKYEYISYVLCSLLREE